MVPKMDGTFVQNYDILLIDFEWLLEPGTLGEPPTSERDGAVEGGRREA